MHFAELKCNDFLALLCAFSWACMCHMLLPSVKLPSDLMLQAARQQLEEYQILTALPHAPIHAGTSDGGSSGGSSGCNSPSVQAQAVCDRCMQPIDDATHAAGLQRLQVCSEAEAMKGLHCFSLVGKAMGY